MSFEQVRLSFTKSICRNYRYGFIVLLICFPVTLTAHLLLQQGCQLGVKSAFGEIGCIFSIQKLSVWLQNNWLNNQGTSKNCQCDTGTAKSLIKFALTLLSNWQVIWCVKVRVCWNNKRNPNDKLGKNLFFEQAELSFTKWNCKNYSISL